MEKIDLCEVMELGNIIEELDENIVKCNIDIEGETVGTMIIEYVDNLEMSILDISIFENKKNIVTETDIANSMFKCANAIGLTLNIKMSNSEAFSFFANC